MAIPTFTIKSNGAPIDAAIQIISIDTATAFGEPATARIAVFDGSAADQDFPISAGPTFAPGAAIAISAGYDGSEQTIFEGIVAVQRIEIDPASPSKLIVEAAAADIIAPPTTMPAPVLTLTFGDNILALKASTEETAPKESSGDVQFQGSALAVPGAASALAGLGTRFNGTALIVGVQQHLAEGQWTTTATYGPPDTV